MGSTNNVFDVSYFFVFEVTDDSEFGLDSPVVEGARVDDADDDAESCCYDSNNSHCDESAIDDRVCDVRMDDQDHLGFSSRRIEDEENEGDDEEEVKMLVKVEELKSETASINSSSVEQEQPMTEMEKSRRFWEACLAS